MRRTAALVGAVLALSACGPPASVPPEAGATQTCPATFPSVAGKPWVPAPPTTETPGRLVPDADPVEAVVCRYGDVFDAESAGLLDQVVLRDGLDRIRTDLLVPAAVEGTERACTAMGGRFLPHLLRLRYADGELWLSAVQEPNGCSPSGNGEFVSSAYLGDLLASAHDVEAWPARPLDPCAAGALGRAGQEQQLVPAGWTSLVACDQGQEVEPDRAAQAASLLGQLETRPGTNACEGTPSAVHELAFTYPEGPPVVLRWTPGCEPSLGNGSLSAVPTPAQAELLTVLLG